MFPHTITIYLYDEKTDTYTNQVVKGVYWSGSDSVALSETRSHSGSTTIVVPKTLMNDIKVENGCYIAKGEHDNITSMKDLEDMTSIQVSNIQVNDSGWSVDNITIYGS